MKTSLFLFALGLGACTLCEAQDLPKTTRNNFRHHEISVGYGFLPSTDWNSVAEEIIVPVMSLGLYKREDTRYYGALNISYTYRINPKFSVGITGGITGNKGRTGNVYEGGKAVKDNRRYIYLLPTFRYHWFHRENFSLYSSVALGAYFLQNKVGNEVHHKTKFAYQVNYLGIEYGKSFAFFVELGVGNQGTIIAGGRYRF